MVAIQTLRCSDKEQIRKHSAWDHLPSVFSKDNITALWPGFWRQKYYKQMGSEYFYKRRGLHLSWRVYVSGWSSGFSIQESFNFLMVNTANLEENIYWTQGTCFNEKSIWLLYGPCKKIVGTWNGNNNFNEKYFPL